MKRILTIDLKDYTDDMTRFRRPSVRAVIIADSMAAMVYSTKYDYYKFPGGGIENNESHLETLIREVREETGLSVIADSVKEFGSVLRIQRSRFNPDEIFEQENFYYLCSVSESKDKQLLDEYELEEGFTLKYVYPEEAIEVNRTHDHSGYDSALIEREALVLERLVDKGLL